MIIKSMSRKTQSFGQMIEYMRDIEKSELKYNIYQNLYNHEAADIEAEFQENADKILRRKNGVYLYHEILSISDAEKLERNSQKEKLRDIAYEYARRRAPNNLVFGTLHDDHDEHLHYHLLISSNALGESKKTRLSKAQFDQLKKSMEAEVLEKYPELEQAVVINRQANEKLSQKGYEQKRRTGNTPQRDLLKEKLKGIFRHSESKQAFFSAMTDEGLELYIRGNSIGVLDHSSNRKHRLKTLGILDDFKKLSDRIELEKKITKSSEKLSQTDTSKKSAESKDPNQDKQKADSTKEGIQNKRSDEIKNMREKQSQSESGSESKGSRKR